VASVLILAGTGRAATITTLFNTGVDAAGVPRANNASELHYSLFSVPSGTTTVRVATAINGFPIGPWLGDDSISAWIGPASDGSLNGPSGNYTYRTTFDLTGFIPSSASITGQWAQDNTGVDIQINGASIGAVSNPGFGSFGGFSIGSGFIAGVNTLDFIINNGGGPTGLRVEMTGAANVASVGAPEPGTLVLLGLGVTAFTLRRRRQA
jgi:hypothetical protein